MIAACPKCGARYRIEEGRLGPQGARLRCARCEAVFRVRAPQGGARPESPPAERPLVLVADASPDSGRATARALSALGLEVKLVHDAVEALLEIQRRRPRAAVIDAALSGARVCELMKRNEGFRSIPLVLVGPRERTRAPGGAEEYRADAELERSELTRSLAAVLRRLGLEVGPAPAPPSPPAPRPAAGPQRPGEPARGASAPRRGPDLASPAGAPGARREPDPASRASGRPAARSASAPGARSEPQASGVHEGLQASVVQGLDPAEVAKAQRLARIVVSDIVLYNAARFDAAVRAGNVLEAMREEIAEGQALFRQRIEARVRDSADFLGQELLRVAALRRAR